MSSDCTMNTTHPTSSSASSNPSRSASSTPNKKFLQSLHQIMSDPDSSRSLAQSTTKELKSTTGIRANPPALIRRKSTGHSALPSRSRRSSLPASHAEGEHGDISILMKHLYSAKTETPDSESSSSVYQPPTATGSFELVMPSADQLPTRRSSVHAHARLRAGSINPTQAVYEAYTR